MRSVRQGMLSVFALLMLAPLAASAEPRGRAEETIGLPLHVAPPCIAIDRLKAGPRDLPPELAIVIPDQSLKDRIAKRPLGRWQTEPERQALIAANRAEPLLAAAGLGTGALGCRHLAHSAVSPDSRFLVMQLLESGDAGVWSPDVGYHSRILLHNHDPQCRNGPVGGMIFRLASGEPFFSIDTCVW